MVRLKVRFDDLLLPTFMFQFLMVRLKEHEVATALVLDKFQFLMVRLKGLIVVSVSNVQASFNSLWYD